jgi:hypothetical protein
MSDEFQIEEAWASYKDLIPVENLAALAQTIAPYLGQPIEGVVPSIVPNPDGGTKIEKIFFATADLWADVKPDGSDITIVRRRAYWIGWNFRPADQTPWVGVRIDHAQQGFSIIQCAGRDATTWSGQLRALFPPNLMMG